ncbi:MAG TPA: dTMP kinase [Armatimonadota bacterium]|nr:dTMP kinase [Armatimonadota bacterium]
MTRMFITFEGPEGAGKTTQVLFLAEALREHGREVVTTREPGGVAVAEAIRELVLHERVWPETEALLFLAARAEHMYAVVRPALERGAVVLCDRFNDSTLAYQGYGLGLPVERLRDLCEFATGGVQPDLTLLLDLPPETGLKRRMGAAVAEQLHLEIDVPAGQAAPQAINKMENRDLEFHRRVREGFRKEAERAPQRIYMVDAARSARQVQAAIWREVKRRLPSSGKQTG